MEFGEDKLNHLIAGFVLSGLGIFWTPLYCTGFVYGVGKEVYDKYRNGNTPEFWDVIATWIGACGSLIFMVI